MEGTNFNYPLAWKILPILTSSNPSLLVSPCIKITSNKSTNSSTFHRLAN